MALGKSRWKVMVSLTSLGEVEHRPAWKYLPEDGYCWERFRGPVMRIADDPNNRMLLWRADDVWYVGSEYGMAVAAAEVGELTVRLLLLKTPREVMRWAQQQQ